MTYAYFMILAFVVTFVALLRRLACLTKSGIGYPRLCIHYLNVP